jgi:signal transduction histidine kinase
MISHELRTPLTGILGAVDLLVKGYGGQLSALQTELADAALRQSRAMSALIDKAVMVANIETGQLHFAVQPTCVDDIVEAAANDLVRRAGSNVQLTFNFDEDVPPVMVDPQKIRIVLEQLIDNAIKYGDGEPIEVIVRRNGDDVLIGVRDYGMGMAPEQVQQVFGRLNRSADSSNTAQRGLGLGLVIARALIERQGGTIHVESTLGEGSFFWVNVREASDVAQLLVA